MSKVLIRVRAEDIPPISEERLAEMAAFSGDVDLSDLPEWTEAQFRKAIQGQFYKPVKSQVTAKLDKDVLAWLKAAGPGYQTRMNAILRAAMLSSLKGGKEAA